MSITVIVGGQFGSEGKGKVAYLLAKERNIKIIVRVGGSNSGHTIHKLDGRKYILRHLPTPSLLLLEDQPNDYRNIICILPSGNYINTNVLLSEINMTNIGPENLFIDPYAVIISDHDHREEEMRLKDHIGSTASGTGAALQRRIDRDHNIRFVKDEPLLQSYVNPNISEYMRNELYQDQRIIIEGTQGFGLSLLHSEYHPFVTSRDTTAACFVSEAGLSPLDVDEIILVLRSYPIRVSGNSGPLPNEITWDIVTKESGSETEIIEYTSVTNRVRRVARFDPNIVKKAILVNNPTSIVLNHLDYIDIKCKINNLPTPKMIDFIKEVESQIDAPIDYYGLSPISLIKK